MDEVTPTRKSDLDRIAGEYLAGRIGFVEFRCAMLACWEALSRAALSRAEREVWSELIMALRSGDGMTRPGHAEASLYDEAFFQEALPALLDIEGDAQVPPRVTRAREIQRAIGAVLLNEWDPIQVKDVPEAADEYDSYVGGVYRLLVSGASDDEIAGHLSRMEIEMGLGTNPETLMPLVRSLRSVRVDF